MGGGDTRQRMRPEMVLRPGPLRHDSPSPILQALRDAAAFNLAFRLNVVTLRDSPVSGIVAFMVRPADARLGTPTSPSAPGRRLRAVAAAAPASGGRGAVGAPAARDVRRRAWAASSASPISVRAYKTTRPRASR